MISAVFATLCPIVHTLFPNDGAAWNALFGAIYALALAHCLTTFAWSFQYAIAAWLLARSLFVVSAVAFWSFWVQAEGLIGPAGVLPSDRLIQQLEASPTFAPLSLWQRIRRFPTVFFILRGPAWPARACLIGLLASVLGAVGVWPWMSALVCLVLYLSLVKVGREFTALQFDSLLVESLFLLVFVPHPLALLDVPLAVAAGKPALAQVAWVYGPPGRILLPMLLLKWLCFRIMFSSGVVKLTSGDVTWRKCTALCYHYFSQPIPTPLSLFFHNLPVPVHTLSCLMHFFIELVVPFVFLLPSYALVAPALAPVCEMGAFLFLLKLQGMIIVSGNYGFFNYLNIVITLPLLSDATLLRVVFAILPLAPDDHFAALQSHLHPHSPLLLNPLPSLLACVAVCAWMAVSAYALFNITHTPLKPPAWLARLGLKNAFSAAHRWSLINRYGLFAVMTTTRVEVVFFGSNDLIEWKEYKFKYRPDTEGYRKPPQMFGHLPRLDWRLWFSQFGHSAWVDQLLLSLLEGRRPVLALLHHNPFPDAPPKYLKVDAYDFTFPVRPITTCLKMAVAPRGESAPATQALPSERASNGETEDNMPRHASEKEKMMMMR